MASGCKNRRILVLARGEMDAVDVAFWEGVHNELLRNDAELLLLVHHKPQESCSFRWQKIPNMLSEITLPVSESTWMKSRIRKLAAERELELLKLEALWRGEPQTVMRQRELELALFWAEDLLGRIMQDFMPQLVVIWNGFHAIEQVLADLANQAGCPLAWLERGPFPGTLQLDDKGILAASSVAGEPDWSWPARSRQKHWQAIFKNLVQDYTSGASSWWPQPETVGPDAVRSKLGIEPERKVVVFFGQVDEDSQNLFFAPRFDDNLAAWSWLTKHLATESGLMVVGKHHPKSRRLVAEYRKSVELVANAVWVEDISVHDLLQVADLVVAVNSSTIFEALMSGKPALALGDSLLSKKSIAYEITDIDSPAVELKAALQSGDLAQRLERFCNFGAYLLATQLVAMRSVHEKFGLNSRSVFAHWLCERTTSDVDYSSLPEVIDCDMSCDHTLQGLPPVSFAPKSAESKPGGAKVIFSTFDAFWHESMGSEIRNAAFVAYLAQQPLELHVVLTGAMSSADIAEFQARYPSVWLHITNTILPGLKGGSPVGSAKPKPAERPGRLHRALVAAAMRPPFDSVFDRRRLGTVYPTEIRPAEMESPATAERFQQLLGPVNPDFIIVHGLRQAFIHKLAALPEFARTKWLIDTIDIQYLRSRSLHRQGIANGICVSRAEELGMLAEFDASLAISHSEKKLLQRLLPNRTILSATHAVTPVRLPEPEAGNIRIGIVSTWSLKNIYALRWFINNVWIKLHSQYPDIEFYIFGTACRTVGDCLPDGVVLKGEVEKVSEAYPQFQIAVNPIQSGAGLQIKSVESIAYGRPLVTTPLGAEGLTGDGSGVMVAESVAEWQEHLGRLINNKAFRLAKADECARTAKQHFSSRAAFHEVGDFIESSFHE